jgi:hypothetical protein
VLFLLALAGVASVVVSQQMFDLLMCPHRTNANFAVGSTMAIQCCLLVGGELSYYVVVTGADCSAIDPMSRTRQCYSAAHLPSHFELCHRLLIE